MVAAIANCKEGLPLNTTKGPQIVAVNRKYKKGGWGDWSVGDASPILGVGGSPGILSVWAPWKGIPNIFLLAMAFELNLDHLNVHMYICLAHRIVINISNKRPTMFQQRKTIVPNVRYQTRECFVMYNQFCKKTTKMCPLKYLFIVISDEMKKKQGYD